MPKQRRRKRVLVSLFEAINRGKAPDEVLRKNHGKVRDLPLIPVRERDAEFQLPDSELLGAISYYAGKRFKDRTRLFDETALLTIGFLLEHWIDECLEPNGHLLFAEHQKAHETQTLNEENGQKSKKRSAQDDEDVDAEENYTGSDEEGAESGD